MRELPNWLATEHAVEKLFTLIGFDVERVAIEGRQIDIIARRVDRLTRGSETWVIEVTTERVGVTKGSVDGQKLLLSRQRYPNARLMLVSTLGFTNDQQATLEQLGIAAIQFHELESSLLPLRRYALSAQLGLEHEARPDIGYQRAYYIEPALEIRLENSSTKLLGAEEWTTIALEQPQAGVCALLGSLGSGKTSLLRRVMEKGILQFLADPNNRPLPLYVPLGRYKQHAGDLDQMIMAELARAGIETYPAALVRHLIQSQRIILLLDGLDEVHPIHDANDLVETVTNILEALGKNGIGILSCRRQFFESTAEEQAFFGSYTAEKLKDLNQNLHNILRGWPSTYVAVVMPFDEERIRAYLAKRCSMDTDDVQALFDRYYGLVDLATTPVLLAMIAATVTEGSLRFREDEPEFDRKLHAKTPLISLYLAYTQRWIDRDLGRARLSRTQRERFSQYLADRMLWEARESVSWAEIVEILRDDPEWGNNPLTQDEAERDVRNSGFLVRELDNRWRFAHRSILEYFSARAELDRIVSGERPRYIPTDGYRLFLTELIATRWMQEGSAPFPARSWNESRGLEVRRNQWSLLASASATLPEEAAVPLLEVGVLSTIADAAWTSVIFQQLHLSIDDGRVTFQNCDFSRCKLEIPNPSVVVDFERCKFDVTTISFSRMPRWRTQYDVEKPEAMDVPIAVWRLSEWVEAGAEIVVGDDRWLLCESDLSLFLRAVKGLRSKARGPQLTRGADGERLVQLIRSFTQHGLTSESNLSASRSPMLNAVGRSLVAKLQNDPLRGQIEVHAIFKTMRT